MDKILEQIKSLIADNNIRDETTLDKVADLMEDIIGKEADENVFKSIDDDQIANDIMDTVENQISSVNNNEVLNIEEFFIGVYKKVMLIGGQSNVKKHPDLVSALMFHDIGKGVMIYSSSKVKYGLIIFEFNVTINNEEFDEENIF